MPCWFMTIITRSLLWPPICQPMLPPERSKGAGALHPELVRQVARPLPCSPPTMKAPLIMCGITAMHLAPASTESGMPAFPVVICWMISAPWLSLVVAALLSCAQPRDAIRARTHNSDAVFMVYTPPCSVGTRMTAHGLTELPGPRVAAAQSTIPPNHLSYVRLRRKGETPVVGGCGPALHIENLGGTAEWHHPCWASSW